jgi:AcrR family transcriptional regulator
MDAEKSYESKIKARREAKRQILEAAADLIRESGQYYVTLDQIAERLHISKVSIYHHWTSKQEILFDLLRIGYKVFVENLEIIARCDDPPDVKLRRAIENHVAQAVNSGINPMLGDKEWRLVNKYRKEIVKLRDTYDQMFYQIINDGIEQGIFKKVNARLLHFTIMGAANYTWLWYSAKGGMSYKEIAAHMSSFLLDGVLTGAPGKKK